MALCETEDVEALLQVDITPDDDPKIVRLIDMAAGVVDAALGRPAEGGTQITEARTLGAHFTAVHLTLDRWPVTSVASVVEDGETLTVDVDYTVDLAAGIISRIVDASGFGRAWKPSVRIVVTYTPATVPIARTVCAQAVARAFEAGAEFSARPAILGGLRQLTIGRWSATRESRSAGERGAGVKLTEAELALLRAERSRRP